MNRVFQAAALLSAILLQACSSVDDDRIPAYAVSISLSDAGTWNTYGVAGFGNHRRFILTSTLREPRNFPFSTQSATGFGGVLLISGMDPFTATTDTPLAYDLACPVELKPDVRVQIEGDLYEAVCPVCGSRFNVTTGAGRPFPAPQPPVISNMVSGVINACTPATEATS